MPESQGVTNYVQNMDSKIANIDTILSLHANQTACLYIKSTATKTTKTGAYGKILFLRAGNITSITATAVTGAVDISSSSTYAAGTEFVFAMTKVKFTTVGEWLVYGR